jgi:ABC-2 type transport system ATP-binding protein
MVHRPALVILDEPTAGLDVATRSELHGILRDLRRDGTAVLLATHDMAEAEALGDRLTVLVGGRVVASGTPRELTAQGDGRTRVSVSTVHGRLAAEPDVPGATVQSNRDGYLVYQSVDTATTVSALLAKVTRLGDSLVDLRVERPSLEERFLELVRKEAA